MTTSTTTSPQTELDAVNLMLEGIFEAPINSLDVPGVSDGGIARRILIDTKREVLSKGWHFNQEKDVTLSVDTVSSKIPLPNNTLRVDANDVYESRDLTQRGLFLYDKTNKSLLFTTPARVDITYNLEWDDLPEHAKYFIAVRAARKFQDSVLGSGEGRYKAGDEGAALLLLEDAEGDTGDHNILRDNYAVASILSR